jgi:tetratricopeptide (TPR) repeat protein
MRNPLAGASYPQPGGPVPIAPVRVPRGNLSPEWQQAHDLIGAGNYAQAQQLINTQVRKDGSLGGMMSAYTALERANAPAAVLQPLRAEALQLAQTQINQRVNQPMPWIVVAKLSLQDGNLGQFRQATHTLMERHPDSQYAHYFDGITALQDNDYKRAEQALRKSRELGMPEDSVAMLLKIAIDGQKWIWQYATIVFWIIVVWLGGLVLLFFAGEVLSALTLRSLAKDNPETITSAGALLRRVYRIVVNLAGLYYYLSLPILLLLSIALPLSLGYALLVVPFLNLGLVALVLLLGFGSIVTAVSGIRAAFVRSHDQDFGHSIKPQESPELWEVAREVAARAQTRCVDEIRAVPTADIGVIEHGSFLQRQRDRGQRVLILGLHALEGLKLDALKCIMAHEYGHFRNRDTAGGDIALAVNRAMQNFAQAIVRRGKIRRSDVAVHFLRFYHYLFRRLTFGASRLQEVLADRLAVRCYGPSALQEGLTHAIRRSLEFQLAMNKAIREAVQNTRPALAFYGSTALPELAEREQLEAAVKEIVERPTDANDSHPSPKERFELAKQVLVEDHPLSTRTAWDLVASHPNVLNAMNRLVDDLVSGEAKQVQLVQQAFLEGLSRMLRRYPDPNCYFERARIFLDKGDFDSALRDMNEALARYPNHAEILCRRAIIYKTMKRYHEAAEDLDRVVDRFGDRDTPSELRFNLYATLGHCQLQMGRHELAIQAYDKALRIKPKSLVCLVERACASRDLEDYDKALEDLSAAIVNWPNSPEPYLERARVCDIMGRSEQAERDRKTAKQLDYRVPQATLTA